MSLDARGLSAGKSGKDDECERRPGICSWSRAFATRKSLLHPLFGLLEAGRSQSLPATLGKSRGNLTCEAALSAGLGDFGDDAFAARGVADTL